MKINIELAAVPIVQLNREILAHDLCRLKKHLKEINEETIKELDNYFDVVCEMACMDAQVFKRFFRGLIGRKK